MSSLTGAAEGEDPKCLRHTWLRAKLCSSFTFYRPHPSPPPPPPDTSECLCELLYFMIFVTFTFWDSNLKGSERRISFSP